MNEQSQRDYSSSEMYTSDTVRCEHCPIRATIIIQTDDEKWYNVNVDVLSVFQRLPQTIQNPMFIIRSM